MENAFISYLWKSEDTAHIIIMKPVWVIIIVMPSLSWYIFWNIFEWERPANGKTSEPKAINVEKPEASFCTSNFWLAEDKKSQTDFFQQLLRLINYNLSISIINLIQISSPSFKLMIPEAFNQSFMNQIKIQSNIILFGKHNPHLEHLKITHTWGQPGFITIYGSVLHWLI